VSSIELDVSEMTPQQMAELEVDVNSYIRAGCKMFPTLYESKDDPQLLDVSESFTYLLTYFLSLPMETVTTDCSFPSN